MNAAKMISISKFPSNHIVISVVLIWAYWGSTYLYSDGCFFWRKGADLYEPSQKAVIYHKNGREKLILQVKYEGPAEDFAWIVPLPAQPQVEAIPVENSIPSYAADGGIREESLEIRTYRKNRLPYWRERLSACMILPSWMPTMPKLLLDG